MSRTLQTWGSALSRPKNENKKKTSKDRELKEEQNFLHTVSSWRAAINFFSQQHAFIFYCSLTIEMERLWMDYKVNALEIWDYDNFHPYTNTTRKALNRLIL